MATVNVRLVPQCRSIQSQGYFVVHDAPDIATRRQARVVWLACGDYHYGRGARRARGKAAHFGQERAEYLFVDLLHAPVLGLPIVNSDNNQHAANENLRIQNLWDGIAVFASLMARIGQVWQ